jgi:hypothetical protein
LRIGPQVGIDSLRFEEVGGVIMKGERSKPWKELVKPYNHVYEKLYMLFMVD